MACRRSPSSVTGAGSVDAASTSTAKMAFCQRPLAEFCRNERCPTYDGASAELRGLTAALKDSGSCLQRAHLGTCGSFRYVTRSDGYTGHTAYFDGAGQLVAAERSSDANSYCDGRSHSASFGLVPDCNPTVLVDLCAGTWNLDTF